MWTLCLITSIFIIICGIFCAVSVETCSYANEPFFIVGAFVGIVGGIIFLMISMVGGEKKLHKKEIAKTEVVSVDSTEQVKPDSIYAVQYIITWKDDNEIKCGDAILKGKTEKNVGDTIIINLK